MRGEGTLEVLAVPQLPSPRVRGEGGRSRMGGFCTRGRSLASNSVVITLSFCGRHFPVRESEQAERD